MRSSTEANYILFAQEFTERATGAFHCAFQVLHRPDVYVYYLEYAEKNLEKALVKVRADIEQTRVKIKCGG